MPSRVSTALVPAVLVLLLVVSAVAASRQNGLGALGGALGAAGSGAKLGSDLLGKAGANAPKSSQGALAGASAVLGAVGGAAASASGAAGGGAAAAAAAAAGAAANSVDDVIVDPATERKSYRTNGCCRVCPWRFLPALDQKLVGFERAYLRVLHQQAQAENPFGGEDEDASAAPPEEPQDHPRDTPPALPVAAGPAAEEGAELLQTASRQLGDVLGGGLAKMAQSASQTASAAAKTASAAAQQTGQLAQEAADSAAAEQAKRAAEDERITADLGAQIAPFQQSSGCCGQCAGFGLREIVEALDAAKKENQYFAYRQGEASAHHQGNPLPSGLTRPTVDQDSLQSQPVAASALTPKHLPVPPDPANDPGVPIPVGTPPRAHDYTPVTVSATENGATRPVLTPGEIPQAAEADTPRDHPFARVPGTQDAFDPVWEAQRRGYILAQLTERGMLDKGQAAHADSSSSSTADAGSHSLSTADAGSHSRSLRPALLLETKAQGVFDTHKDAIAQVLKRTELKKKAQEAAKKLAAQQASTVTASDEPQASDEGADAAGGAGGVAGLMGSLSSSGALDAIAGAAGAAAGGSGGGGGSGNAAGGVFEKLSKMGSAVNQGSGGGGGGDGGGGSGGGGGGFGGLMGKLSGSLGLLKSVTGGVFSKLRNKLFGNDTPEDQELEAEDRVYGRFASVGGPGSTERAASLSSGRILPPTVRYSDRMTVEEDYTHHLPDEAERLARLRRLHRMGQVGDPAVVQPTDLAVGAAGSRAHVNSQAGRTSLVPRGHSGVLQPDTRLPAAGQVFPTAVGDSIVQPQGALSAKARARELSPDPLDPMHSSVGHGVPSSAAPPHLKGQLEGIGHDQEVPADLSNPLYGLSHNGFPQQRKLPKGFQPDPDALASGAGDDISMHLPPCCPLCVAHDPFKALAQAGFVEVAASLLEVATMDGGGESGGDAAAESLPGDHPLWGGATPGSCCGECGLGTDSPNEELWGRFLTHFKHHLDA